MKLYYGDCLEIMTTLAPASVDLILCDLPYGKTSCLWDSVIPFEQLWAHYRRITKPNAAVVLTASQPFTTSLIGSNLKDFRYEWIWRKNVATNFFHLDKMPGAAHENVCVFYRDQPTYNKQMQRSESNGRAFGCPNGRLKTRRKAGGVYGDMTTESAPIILNEMVSPKSVLDFPAVPNAKGRVHPTQKPVALCEYLIRTYTNAGEVVLDNCMGSGTTGVALRQHRERFYRD